MRTFDLQTAPRPLAAAVHTFFEVHALEACAAEHMAWVLRRALQAREAATLALAGGSSPAGVYRLLAASESGRNLDWSRVHIFWGDERLVPPNHPDSNYALAKKTLLSPLNIPEATIHRMPGESSSPSLAAADYARSMARVFAELDQLQLPAPEPTSRTSESWPIFDLVLLGMGRDGHTASLFPDAHSLLERERWTVAVDPGHSEPHVPRITLTLPVINRARHVLLLVSGPGKLDAARQVLQSSGSLRLPASLVRPAGRLLWLLHDPEDGLADWEAACV